MSLYSNKFGLIVLHTYKVRGVHAVRVVVVVIVVVRRVDGEVPLVVGVPDLMTSVGVHVVGHVVEHVVVLLVGVHFLVLHA